MSSGPPRHHHRGIGHRIRGSPRPPSLPPSLFTPPHPTAADLRPWPRASERARLVDGTLVHDYGEPARDPSVLGAGHQNIDCSAAPAIG
ncbi:hypothetical protein ZWY2020_016966 [Hordeum vulgare]|nr:hypothetical protein ZWY2020_016966 [Hordeum vulgare]